MEFNIQAFLAEMKKELREDNKELKDSVAAAISTLTLQVNETRTTIAVHDTRLVVVENTRRTSIWLAGTLIVAVLGLLGELVAQNFHP